MSRKINNSLNEFLNQAMILEKNNIEMVSKLSDAVSSNDEEIKIELEDPEDPNNKTTYVIPSYGYLKSEIDRLNTTISTMTNINSGSGSSIRLSDGTYRKIIASKVPSEAPTITSVNHVTNFNFKSNWFFEDMLNPALYITWDMTNQVSVDTERVMIQRYILKCDTQYKKDAFDKIKGRNDIGYKEFLNFIVNNKIRYNIDDEIKDLPPRSKRYFGNFSVIKIYVDNENDRSVRRYALNTLYYTDSRANAENTRVLSVGDVVEAVNPNGSITTRYQVTYANVSENRIGLKCIEGVDAVRIGVDTLRISSTQDNEVYADIPVGFDEREVIFCKPIDPDSNIPATNWSPGVSFYTNELTYVDATGTVQTLQSFYQKNVVDFGQVLLSYTTDYYPTIREGLIPNKPILNYESGTGDFKVVKINGQLTEAADSEALRKLIADKALIKSEIENVSKQISAQKEAIQTTNYVSTNEKLNAQSVLNSLISNHSSLISNYNSIVSSIKAKYDTAENASPKYRVRGFWDIPDSRYSNSSGEQKIIRFKIRYRYLSSSGNTNRENEFTYISNGAQVIGRFSNWNEIETKTRERIKTKNGWEWADIDTADPEEVNINQLDIPIQRGEQVEIQVKSVSEAGWPSNPMESDWSDPITVAFSDFTELEADDIYDIIEQNRVDASFASLGASLSSTTEHMSSSFYTNDKYFAHTAENITSGFLSPEQTPITLYDKLQDLQKQITLVTEKLNNAQGKVVVSLIDDSNINKVYTLENGTTTYINAGSYTDEISNIDEADRKGAIITKVFYVEIKSNISSGLYLLSKLSGNRLSMCPNTIDSNYINDFEYTSGDDKNDYTSYDNIVNPSSVSSNYYKERGRYDLVPINLINSDFIDFQIASPNMYQSAQCKGQFVYSRFRNIGDTFDMYANDYDINGFGIFNPDAKFSNSEMVYETEAEMIKEYYGMNGDEFSGVLGDDDYRYKSLDVNAEYDDTTDSDDDTPQEKIIKKIRDEYVNLTAIEERLPINVMEKYMNRLPKNWDKKPSSSQKLLGNKLLLSRISSKNKGDDLTDKIKTSSKMAERLKNLTENTTKTYLIEPSIQSTYGFSDLGSIIHGNNSADGEVVYDSLDYSFMTTHKIGYEEKDRYSKGEKTCNSYVFLSPINHEAIQVDGDTQTSTVFVDTDESIKVPIIYQYRMTDYNGFIFGDDSLDSTSDTVKNKKMANIIGLDIWTTSDIEKPNQYDIVIYSTYGSTITTDTLRTKTSSQSLANAITSISNSFASMIKQSQTVDSNIMN